MYQFWILMTALFLFLNQPTPWILFFFPFSSAQFVCTENKDLTKARGGSSFLLSSLFWFSLWVHEVREWIIFLLLFFLTF